MADGEKVNLARKYPLKAGMRVLLIDAPDSILERLRADHDGSISETGPGPFDVVQLFARDSTALAQGLDGAERALAPDGILWIAYPKKGSGVPTDLTRDEGWAGVFSRGWQVVRQIALDEVWSSLRFKRVADADVRGDVDMQYSGTKAGLRPIYDEIAAFATSLSSDVSVYIRKDYVAFSRGKHFAAVSPATRSRVDLSLKLKGEPYTERARPFSGAGGGSFTHTVAVASVDEVDDEVRALIRLAWARTG